MTPLLLLAALTISADPIEEPADALRLVVAGPDRQLDALLALFRGAKAPHPAAALAGWKRANGGETGFSKAIDAAITLLNPESGRELMGLDGMTARIHLDPADGEFRWSVRVPRDDGTLGALATALALTDGAREASLEGVPVDRLGPPSSPVMANREGTTYLAGRREELAIALRSPTPIANGASRTKEGWIVTADPEPWRRARWLPARQAAEALLGLGVGPIDGIARIEGETLLFRSTSPIRADQPRPGIPLDPDTLEAFPAEGLAAFLAVAIEPTSESWDALFHAIDRALRADPARAEAAPLRTRINVLALPAGIQPEADLWPRLLGLTAGAYAEGGRLDGVRLRLRTTGDDAARRIADRILPRALGRLGLLDADPEAVEGLAHRSLGRLSGRPLRVASKGADVLMSWGDGPAFADLDPAGRAAIGPLLKGVARPERVDRLAIVWPSRIGLAPPGSPVEAALAEASPIAWVGGSSGRSRVDEVAWPRLDRVVRRFLDVLPMDRPPQTLGGPGGVARP